MLVYVADIHRRNFFLINIQGSSYVLNKMIQMISFQGSENTDYKEVDQTVQFWLIMPLQLAMKADESKLLNPTGKCCASDRLQRLNFLNYSILSSLAFNASFKRSLARIYYSKLYSLAHLHSYQCVLCS